MRILIFGATGMVGQGVLRECLRDARVAEVVAVGRAASGRHDPKLTEIMLADMFGIAALADRLAGFDACFFCLGVSSLGMSEAEYARLTYDLTTTVARVLAPLNPAMTFVYVTGSGTRRDSRQNWARVKARTENALAALPFRAAYFFRPGFIQPLDGIVSKTRWYMAIYAVIRPFSPLLVRRFPNLATTTERLGRAMINVAAVGYPRQVLETTDINAAGRRINAKSMISGRAPCS
jgi:uncharacterized protein YbjT (DUF2867 family)